MSIRPTPFVLLFSLLAVIPAFSQSLTTANQYVSARVESLTGLVTIREGASGTPITGAQKSFLCVMISDRIFTNNNVGINIQTDPRFGGLLLDGSNQKIGDTIRTTWANKQNCDIIQDVYPVKLTASGQIVIKWSVKNNSPNTPIWGQAQFLVDVHNSSPEMLTRYGYRSNWEQFNSASTYGMPWFYAHFEHKLPNSPTFDLGAIGVGYVEDVVYSLGVTKPATMTIGDWGAPLGAALADNLWGVSGAAPWSTPFQDPAVMLQWDGKGIGGNKTAEIARTSYGTFGTSICNGDPFIGMLFYPPHFVKNGGSYKPETGKVEYYGFYKYSTILFDSNYREPPTNADITLIGGPNIKEKEQLHPLDINLHGSQYDAVIATWTITPDRASDCTNSTDSWLMLITDVSSDGYGLDTCMQPLTIDCISDDTLPPIVTNLVISTTEPYRQTFDIVDNRVLDTGIDTITWVPRPGTNTDPSKFMIETSVLLPCSKQKHLARVTQLDSTIAGCFDFTIADCGGNQTEYTICMTAHPTMPGLDTLPPEVVISRSQISPNAKEPCNAQCYQVTINELRPNDSGLEEVLTITPANMTFVKTDSLNAKTTATFKACVIDSTKDALLQLRARDLAGNITDTVLCYQRISGSVEPHRVTSELELLGNPASKRATVRFTLREAQTIKLSILDMTGRVLQIRSLGEVPAGSTDVYVETTELSAGTYYIVAEWSGRQYAKKLSVVK